MGLILQDLYFAIRRLLKTPVFSLIAVLGIAVGIGANSAVFSVLNGVVFRPLPYENADRLAIVSGYHPEIGRFSASYPDFIDLKENNNLFDYFAAYYQKNITLTGTNEPERLRGICVSAEFFPMFGATPALGRFFLPEEEMRKEAPVVVLSHALWETRFGSDPKIIGQNLTLNGEGHTVIGVAPANFRPPVRAQLWVPFTVSDDDKVARGTRFIGIFALLKPGVTVGQAQSGLEVITRQLEQQYPDTNAGRRAILTPLHDQLTRTDRVPLLMSFGAVVFVLLIACFNLANLFMARALSRTKQIGILIALGANRMNIVMQFLTESMTLALTGGALGLLFSIWARDILITWLSINPLIQTSIDFRILLFTLGLSLLTGLISGLIPAIRISKVDPLVSLKESGSSGSTPGRNNLLNALVSAEVALALALVVGAIIMIKSLSMLQKVELGFSPSDLLTMNISIPGKKYSTQEQRTAFFAQILQRAEALPGVQGASSVSLVPLSETVQATKFFIEGRLSPSGNQLNRSSFHVISPRYFDTMKIPVISGRVFTEQDANGAQEVAIVSRKMAERFWPNEDPIGQRISLNNDQGPWVTIVGIVGDVKYLGLDAESEAEFYLPFLQSPQSSMAVVLRCSNPSTLIAPMRSVVASVDKDQPVYNVITMKEIIDERLGKERALTDVLGLFGLIALMMAGLGIYGVTSYSVSRRAREIGIRMALGAQKKTVVALVVKQSLLFVLFGIAAGLAGAIILTHGVSSLLYGVRPLDPVTFALSSLILILVGVAASYIPARKAALVDPAIALRLE